MLFFHSRSFSFYRTVERTRFVRVDRQVCMLVVCMCVSLYFCGTRVSVMVGLFSVSLLFFTLLFPFSSLFLSFSLLLFLFFCFFLRSLSRTKETARNAWSSSIIMCLYVKRQGTVAHIRRAERNTEKVQRTSERETETEGGWKKTRMCIKGQRRFSLSGHTLCATFSLAFLRCYLTDRVAPFFLVRNLTYVRQKRRPTIFNGHLCVVYVFSYI